MMRKNDFLSDMVIAFKVAIIIEAAKKKCKVKSGIEVYWQWWRV